MINAKEINYPDGTKIEKLNLVSNNITLSKMDPVDWDSLFDENDNPTPEFDFQVMDCFFTLTPMLTLIDKSGNEHKMGDLEIGEKIKYMGEQFEIYDTEKISGLFAYILEKSGKIKETMDDNGVN